MSARPRGTFNPDNPFPEGGVVTPNVFPTPIQGRHGRLDLHDILEGVVPKVRRGQTVRQGWLRIAFGNGQDLDYSSPHLSEAELDVRRGNSRRTLDIDLEVEEAHVIKRVATQLVPAALELPSFNGRSFSFAEDEPELVKVTPVEHAIAFAGIANINDQDMVVRGIHFASCEQNGWMHIGDPIGPLEPAA